MSGDSSAATGRPLLDLKSLMAAAQQLAGLEDYGDQAFVARAETWLRIAGAENVIGERGLAGLAALVTGWMVNRLRMVEDFKKHPEILQEPIRAPIFVTGMPRTGTTKLQRVLACDPNHQSLPFWLALNLSPFPEADPSKPDPRIALAAGYIEAIKAHYPDFLAGHPIFVDEPEEECFWLEADFQSLTNCMRVRAPSYLRQIIDTPDFESHGYLKQALQYVQWQRGGSGDKTWVLKTPSHFGNLRSLFRHFPDATVVHTYRDPIVAMGSICRIFELFRSLTLDEIDLKELGDEQLQLWTRMQQRYLEVRDDPAYSRRIIDVHYDDVVADVFKISRDIYERRGETLGATTEKLMRTYEAEHPQHQFGKHQYTLERYGLTPEKIRQACAVYMNRFDRPREAAAAR